MKKIHFVSLKKCYEYGMFEDEPQDELFFKLPDLIPGTTHYRIGPYFTSVDEATTIAFEGFLLLADRELKDVFRKGPFDLALGSIGLLSALVSPETLNVLDSFRRLDQILDLGPKELFLEEARKSLGALFEALPPKAECLVFTVFPFGEMLCREYMRENYQIPIFEFLQGFSLLNEEGVIRARLLQ